MSSERLAQLLGDVDEKYILETMPQKRPDTRKYIMIAAAAASFMIMVSSVYFFRIGSGNISQNSTSEFAELQSTSVSKESEMPAVVTTVSGTEKNEDSGHAPYTSLTLTETVTDVFSEHENKDGVHTVPVTEVPVISVITEKTDVLSSKEEPVSREPFQSTVSETRAEQTEVTSVSEILPFPQVGTVTETSDVIFIPDAFDISKADFIYAEYEGRKYVYSGDHCIPDDNIGKPAFVKYIVAVEIYQTDIMAESYTGNEPAGDSVIFLDLTHDGNYKVFVNRDLSDEEKDLLIKQITYS